MLDADTSVAFGSAGAAETIAGGECDVSAISATAAVVEMTMRSEFMNLNRSQAWAGWAVTFVTTAVDRLSFQLFCPGVSPVVSVFDDAIVDDPIHDDPALLERAWHGLDNASEKSTTKINSATLTVTRNSGSDFQDRQVFLYVDDELWGKVKYGRPMTREIPPGRHKVRAFNTLFSHSVEIDAVPGEHVRLRCSNGLPPAGFLMFIFLHCTALRVRLERE